MQKLKLHPITDTPKRNRFCGPSALSAITGLSTGECAATIRRLTGRRNIMGTSEGELSEALSELGYCFIDSYHKRYGGKAKTRPTIAAWLKMSIPDRKPGRLFLIEAGNHWQIVMGRKFTCGRIRDIVSIKDKRVPRRARVRGVYEVIKK